MADRNAIVQPQGGPEGFYRTHKTFGVTALAILAADVGTINNTVQLFTVPRGFVPMSLYFNVPTSLAASALTLSLGYTGATAAFLSASTLGVAGGATSTIVAAAINVKMTADTQIQLLVAAAGVTPAAGTITALLTGYMDIG